TASARWETWWEKPKLPDVPEFSLASRQNSQWGEGGGIAHRATDQVRINCQSQGGRLADRVHRGAGRSPARARASAATPISPEAAQRCYQVLGNCRRLFVADYREVSGDAHQLKGGRVG